MRYFLNWQKAWGKTLKYLKILNTEKPFLSTKIPKKEKKKLRTKNENPIISCISNISRPLTCLKAWRKRSEQLKILEIEPLFISLSTPPCQ